MRRRPLRWTERASGAADPARGPSAGAVQIGRNGSFQPALR